MRGETFFGGTEGSVVVFDPAEINARQDGFIFIQAKAPAGGACGASLGGAGARVGARFNWSPGDKFEVVIGGVGQDCTVGTGGHASGAGGSGAIFVRRVNGATTERLMVVGGGGGAARLSNGGRGGFDNGTPGEDTIDLFGLPCFGGPGGTTTESAWFGWGSTPPVFANDATPWAKWIDRGPWGPGNKHSELHRLRRRRWIVQRIRLEPVDCPRARRQSVGR